MPLPDVDDFTATYGGPKADYAPSEDPTTDESAAVRNQYAANVAMMTATVPRGRFRFTAAVTSGAMVLVSHNAVWGNAPGVAPALARFATGIFTATLPVSVNDALGVAHTVNIMLATVNSRSAGVAYFHDASTAANVITIYIQLGSTAAANDAVGVDFEVVYY